MFGKYVLYFTILLIVFIMPFGELHSQVDNSSVFDNVLKKYSGVKSVAFSFSSKEQPGYKGKIKAKLGNMYIIQSGSRDVYCNGKTIWNYTKNDNKVVVSSYEDAAGDELSLEKVFFNFLQQYKAVSVSKNLSSKGPPAYEIVLEPKNKAAKVSSVNLSKVIILVDRKNFSLLSITVNDNGALQTWNLTKIKLNVDTGDEVFTFKVPDGASVVDLR